MNLTDEILETASDLRVTRVQLLRTTQAFRQEIAACTDEEEIVRLYRELGRTEFVLSSLKSATEMFEEVEARYNPDAYEDEGENSPPRMCDLIGLGKAE